MTGLNTKIRGRRSALLFGLVMSAAIGLSACTSTPDTSAAGESGQGPAGGHSGQTAAAKLVAQPSDGAKDVAPGEPVRVSVTDGTIGSVSLTNPEGKQVQGQVSEDKRSWTTTEPLGYGKSYSWQGNAVGSDGKQVPLAGSFTTVTPKKQLEGKLNVGDDQTYGIAMPIALTFTAKVTDKAAVEKAISVETTPKTEGSWAWLEGDTSVHWRPKEYYQPGTQVKVNAKLYGVKLGEGVYGKQDVSSNFQIGRAQLVKGNTQQHRMQVIRDGQQIADYPVSYGLDSDPGRVTKSGTHVVMSKHPTYSMSNPRYNYTDVNVPWAVRISNNGEFIHGLSASIWAQGKKNISHGCLNLSPKNAKEYFDGVLPGDPVEIEGSTQKLGPNDHDYADWTYSWEEWTAKSALNS
ncbi:L,D-transpeptidase [Amycolatopsis nigrescens]|uniref:L,D-transpeptidase n=1 Tax=Amycolatopsis nigrescens TaxID=381445 RepID=UPI00039A216B|nr:Ig-like domain-containing protein [Amycolatopsis nigrescens]